MQSQVRYLPRSMTLSSIILVRKNLPQESTGDRPRIHTDGRRIRRSRCISVYHGSLGPRPRA